MALSWQKSEELIAKKHQAFAECLKRDKQFLELVKNEDLKGVQALYPDATSLLKYANVSGPVMPYRDSFLATLCRESSPEFISSFFEAYFPEFTDETLALKEKFLQGKTREGQQLDYHWFSKYLSPALTSRVNGAFGITNSKASTEENSEKKKIYDIIKEQHASLQEFENKKIGRYKRGLTFGEEKPATLLEGDGWYMAEESMPPVILRQLPSLDGMTPEEKNEIKDDDFSKDKVVELEFWGNPSDLLKSTYEKLHFPEDYLWASRSLERLQEEYGQMIQDEKLRTQIKRFSKEGGRILIENRGRQNHIGNSFGSDYMAYSNGKDVVIDGPVYGYFSKEGRRRQGEKNVLAHELGHDTDIKYGGEKQRLENYDWAKWAYMLIDIKDKNPLRASITDQINNSYPPDQYVVEFVANLTQRPTMVSAKDGKGQTNDPLLSKIYDIIALRGDIAARPEELGWMKDYMDKHKMTGQDADIMKKLHPVYVDYAQNIRQVYNRSRKDPKDKEVHAKGLAETSQKIKEILGNKTAKELEQSLTDYLTSMLEGAKLGKEL